MELWQWQQTANHMLSYICWWRLVVSPVDPNNKCDLGSVFRPTVSVLASGVNLYQMLGTCLNTCSHDMCLRGISAVQHGPSCLVSICSRSFEPLIKWLGLRNVTLLIWAQRDKRQRVEEDGVMDSCVTSQCNLARGYASLGVGYV